MRHYEPRWGEDSVNFALLNRGKRSVALDLKDDEDRARLQPMVERADVIIEQFRPGVMARLGLDYETVKATNPGDHLLLDHRLWADRCAPTWLPGMT